MIIVVEVGLATSRSPREHMSVHVVVSVDVVDFDFAGAEAEAQVIAACMAMGAADAQMPVRTTIIDILEI